MGRRVIGTAHERSGFDVLESHLDADALQLLKLVDWHIAVDWQMHRRRTQVNLAAFNSDLKRKTIGAAIRRFFEDGGHRSLDDCRYEAVRVTPGRLSDVFPDGSVVRETLPNGLRVLVRRKPGCGVVTIVTYVGAGYFDETDDISGIAHVLACCKHGKVAGAGGLGGQPELMQKLIHKGLRFATAGIEWDFMLAGARQRVGSLRELTLEVP